MSSLLPRLLVRSTIPVQGRVDERLFSPVLVLFVLAQAFPFLPHFPRLSEFNFSFTSTSPPTRSISSNRTAQIRQQKAYHANGVGFSIVGCFRGWISRDRRFLRGEGRENPGSVGRFRLDESYFACLFLLYYSTTPTTSTLVLNRIPPNCTQLHPLL